MYVCVCVCVLKPSSDGVRATVLQTMWIDCVTCSEMLLAVIIQVYEYRHCHMCLCTMAKRSNIYCGLENWAAKNESCKSNVCKTKKGFKKVCVNLWYCCCLTKNGWSNQCVLFLYFKEKYNIKITIVFCLAEFALLKLTDFSYAECLNSLYMFYIKS